MRRFLYRLSEERLGEILAEEPLPLEVIERIGNEVLVASYEPIGSLEPVRVEEVQEDWRSWRDGFGPVEVEDFVIIPPWKIPLLINPGMAFGTGLHPTTRLCMRMMRVYLREGDSVLDVGTGSGILAIAARKLGAGRVLGIDISPDAVRSCEENARLNGLEVECRLAKPAQIEERFDLLVANLELPVFREELDSILPLFRRNAIFSGIYRKAELEEFLDMLEQRGLKADRILEDQDWFCVGIAEHVKIREGRDRKRENKGLWKS